jgi:hypothetical protein
MNIYIYSTLVRYWANGQHIQKVVKDFIQNFHNTKNMIFGQKDHYLEMPLAPMSLF